MSNLNNKYTPMEVRAEDQNVKNFFEGGANEYGQMTKFVREYKDGTEYVMSLYNFHISRLAGGACEFITELTPSGGILKIISRSRDASKYLIPEACDIFRGGTYIIVHRDSYGETSFVDIFEPKG